jgi:hypothetical protein
VPTFYFRNFYQSSSEFYKFEFLNLTEVLQPSGCQYTNIQPKQPGQVDYLYHLTVAFEWNVKKCKQLLEYKNLILFSDIVVKILVSI